LTNEEFVLLRDYVYEKSGIYFAENKAYLLESRLTNRVNELGFGSFEDYYYFLKYDGDKVKAEIVNLFNVVTTNETSFYRNGPQLDAFKVIIQKNYLNNGIPDASIRIWSAACSTGEEPYTLAIIMLELMEQLNKEIPFVIFATDISMRALESARKGEYNTYSVRNMAESIKNRFFAEENGTYKLKESVKKLVKFDFMNLTDTGAYKTYRQIDLIFCRNALIYFHEKIKKRVIEDLYESLRPQGYLTIGPAESLHNISRAFKPLLFPGAIAYQKG
jgi:chemotaxis protein methyltransferase CheR